MSLLGRMMGPVAPLWGVGGLAAASLFMIGGFSARADAPSEQPRDAASMRQTLGAVCKLLSEPRLAVFLATYLLFNVANGAVVQLMIERYAFFHLGDPAIVTAICIVVAQITMAPVAFFVGKKASQWPRKPLFVFALVLQPIRDGLVVLSAGWPTLTLVQILDGLSSGIILVLFYAILSFRTLLLEADEAIFSSDWDWRWERSGRYFPISQVALWHQATGSTRHSWSWD
ncbi:hypothetical protein AA3250_1077 [Gluconobacter albidus NBRC 3250]|nr:hypothetical protein AA3250_1077 [Gluconobacter albidus NBRC 3250]